MSGEPNVGFGGQLAPEGVLPTPTAKRNVKGRCPAERLIVRRS